MNYVIRTKTRVKFVYVLVLHFRPVEGLSLAFHETYI